jgi:hypothetical protein
VLVQVTLAKAIPLGVRYDRLKKVLKIRHKAFEFSIERILP